MPMSLSEVFVTVMLASLAIGTIHQVWIRYIRLPMPGDEPAPFWVWIAAGLALCFIPALMFIGHAAGF